jgi:hypothetical protein
MIRVLLAEDHPMVRAHSRHWGAVSEAAHRLRRLLWSVRIVCYY